jgi:hypothetical protein
MVRAVETAVIISDSLPDIPVKTCQTLCEGAPILPEPEVTHWTPKPWVMQNISCMIKSVSYSGSNFSKMGLGLRMLSGSISTELHLNKKKIRMKLSFVMLMSSDTLFAGQSL